MRDRSMVLIASSTSDTARSGERPETPVKAARFDHGRRYLHDQRNRGAPHGVRYRRRRRHVSNFRLSTISNDAPCSSRMHRRHAGDTYARMRGAGARYAALCTIASCMGHAAVSAADTAPVQIPYTAPPDCPDASVFADELAKRAIAPQGGRSNGADDPRRLSVHIEKREGGFEGQLTVAHEGAVGTRQVRSADCAAVVRSLAVFVALALAERPESAPQTSVRKEDEAPPPAPASPRQLDRPRFNASRGLHTPKCGADAPSETRCSERSGGSIRDPSPIQQSWRRRVRRPRVGRVVSPLRLNPDCPGAPPLVGILGLRPSRRRWRRDSFSAATARAEVCAGTVWGRTHNSLCGAFEVGELAVASSGLPRSGRAESSWSAGGLIARTRVTILDPVGVELALGLFSPFQRPEFTLIDPVRQVHRVPPVALDGQLGIAVSTRWK